MIVRQIPNEREGNRKGNLELKIRVTNENGEEAKSDKKHCHTIQGGSKKLQTLSYKIGRDWSSGCSLRGDTYHKLVVLIRH